LRSTCFSLLSPSRRRSPLKFPFFSSSLSALTLLLIPPTSLKYHLSCTRVLHSRISQSVQNNNPSPRFELPKYISCNSAIATYNFQHRTQLRVSTDVTPNYALQEFFKISVLYWHAKWRQLRRHMRFLCRQLLSRLLQSIV
jgi:hypothetical protein